MGVGRNTTRAEVARPDFVRSRYIAPNGMVQVMVDMAHDRLGLKVRTAGSLAELVLRGAKSPLSSPTQVGGRVSVCATCRREQFLSRPRESLISRHDNVSRK